MPKPGFPLLLLLWGAFLNVPAKARKGGCPEHLKDIKRLYAARDPDLLTANILEPGCSPRELYQAAYYQGFGFYFVGRYKDALANFQLARSLSGPWDEQILQYIWTIQGKLGDNDGQSKTLDEFREDFPKSRKLVEMETAERRAVKSTFDGLVTSSFGWQMGDKSYQGARSQSLMGGSWTQSRSNHALSEYLNLTGNFSMEERHRHNYGIEGGLLYRGPALSAQAEVGRMRSIYPTVRLDPVAGSDVLIARDSVAKVREWVWSASAAYAFRRPEGWTWTAHGNYLRFDGTFSSMAFTWEMDKRMGLKTFSFESTAELLDFGEEGACLSRDQGLEVCGPSRFAAAEAVLGGERTAGRHIMGAEVLLRLEEGLEDSEAWRRLAAAGLSHGYRLSPGVKLSNVLDLGGEWRKEDRRPYELDPVVVLRTSLAWFF